MARNCGCSGASCGCLVTGGAAIDVTGTGTASDPYVVDLDPTAFQVTPYIQFQDSDELAFETSGGGTQASPLIVQAVHKPGVGTGTKKLLASQNVSGNLALASLTDACAVRIVLTGDTTIISLPTPPAGVTWEVDVFVTQDGTGTRTLTWPPILTAGGTPPSIATGANAKSLVRLLWDGAEWWAWTAVNGGA